jgi:hypothetical protein
MREPCIVSPRPGRGKRVARHRRPRSRWRIVCSLGCQHTAMLEGMLLLLLTLGGGTANSPAAAVSSLDSPDAVVGVWRGTWATSSAGKPVSVEAIVTPPSKDGQVLALVATGVGQSRRTTRVTGRIESDGARFMMPGGGTLRLAAASASRLIGIVKDARADGPTPGDGTLELARVRR